MGHKFTPPLRDDLKTFWGEGKGDAAIIAALKSGQNPVRATVDAFFKDVYPEVEDQSEVCPTCLSMIEAYTTARFDAIKEAASLIQ